MGRKTPQPKRKRDESPEISLNTRHKRQKTLSSFTAEDDSRGWIKLIPESGEITQDCAQAACGFGRFGTKQCCPNKSANKKLASLDGAAENAKEVIELSDSDEEVQIVCSKGKCKANPYCLNYLSQEKWEDPVQLKKMVLEQLKERFKGDPHRLLRKDGTPVGLRNLGATCYANAALQVWNQDLEFRSGVFQCNPSIKDTELLESSPIYQLQVTFAALSQGAMKIFNPRPLIESLRLNSGEQQDAQEFSKLFLSLIAGEFEKQDSPILKSLVADQFEGSLTYGTKCHGCGNKSERDTKFLELEISLTRHSTLADCVDELFETEVLSGDNKYRCSQCNNLQDATRYSQLGRLPPVLHFSVQRFVFDFESLTRKKSKNSIRYPMELDMERWLGGPSDVGVKESKHVYELRGVLLHKGSSAYHGHYEAQVFDPVVQKWFQFNDELVTEIKSLKADGDKTSLSSKECYCLIYSRRDIQPVKMEAPSLEVLSKVNQLNEDLKRNCDQYNQSLQASLDQLETLRQSKSTVYRKWHLKDRTNPFRLVPKEAMKAYLEQGLPTSQNPAPSQVDSETNEAPTQPTSKFQYLLCEHGRIHPDKSNDIKLITPDSFNQIEAEIPGLLPLSDSYQQMCTSCIRLRYDEQRYFEVHRALVDDFDLAMERESSPESADPRYWISKPWLKDWRLQKPKMHRFGTPDPSPVDESYRAHVYCEHDGLTHTTQLKMSIPAEAARIIRSLFSDWVLLDSDTPPCVACGMINEDLQFEKQEAIKSHPTEKVNLKSLLLSNPLTADKKLSKDTAYAVIPSAWIRSWKSWINKPQASLRPKNVDNSSFFCSHSKLSFDPAKPQDLADPRISIIKLFEWEEIISFYPNSSPYIGLRVDAETLETKCTAQVCQECRTAGKTKFESSGIVVQVLDKSDPVPTLESFKAAKEMVARQSGFASAGEVSKRSRRLRGEEGGGRLVYISVSPSSTIKDIKSQIEKKEHIHAFYQSLYYNGEELQDSEVTVGELKIEANDLLQLRTLIDSMATTELFDGDDDLEIIDATEEVPSKKAPPVEGRAFQGTLLASG